MVRFPYDSVSSSPARMSREATSCTLPPDVCCSFFWLIGGVYVRVCVDEWWGCVNYFWGGDVVEFVESPPPPFQTHPPTPTPTKTDQHRTTRSTHPVVSDVAGRVDGVLGKVDQGHHGGRRDPRDVAERAGGGGAEAPAHVVGVHVVCVYCV